MFRIKTKNITLCPKISAITDKLNPLLQVEPPLTSLRIPYKSSMMQSIIYLLIGESFLDTIEVIHYTSKYLQIPIDGAA